MYAAALAQHTCLSPRTLEDNIVLRQAVSACLKDGTLPPRRLFTNLKLFASDGAHIFYRKMLERDISDITSGLEIEFSTEDPSQLQHDFVGLLEILAKRRRLIQHSASHNPSKTRMRCLSTDSFDGDAPFQEHIILDGGRKSRNFLLTLWFQYQGMYSLVCGGAWRATLEAGVALQVQFPSGGVDWIMLSSTDYDLVPSDCTVGGKPLANLPHDADFVFFVRPLDANMQEIITSCRSTVLNAIKEFNTMNNVEAYDAIMQLPGNNFYHLAELLMRLSSKGIAVAAPNGKLTFFEEKPSVVRILVDLCQMGTLCENVMYAGFNRRVIDMLLDVFSSVKSATYPDKLLREAVPFGFYETLAAVPFCSSDVWLRQWMKRKAADVDENGWREDGMSVWRLGNQAMKGQNIYLASLGDHAQVGDIGEPRLYARALLNRAFTPIGRRLCGLDGCVMQCEGVTRDRVVIDDADHALLIRSHFSGGGRVIVHSSRESCVIISDSFIHIPDGKEFIIGSLDRLNPCRSVAGGDEDAPMLFVIDTSHVSAGGCVSGAGGAIVIGFDSRREGCGDMPLVSVSPCEVITTLSLRNVPASTHRFSALLAVNRPSGNRTPLKYHMFAGGRTFVEAQRDTDLTLVEHRLEDLMTHSVVAQCSVDWLAMLERSVQGICGDMCDTELREVVVQATAVNMVDPFIGDMLSLDAILAWLEVSEWPVLQRFWAIDYFISVMAQGGWLKDKLHLLDVVADLAMRLDNPFDKAEIIRRFNIVHCLTTPMDGVRVFSAPGRVNGGGAHTDWTFHTVFGLAVPQHVHVAARAIQSDGPFTVHMYSQGMSSRRRVVMFDSDDIKLPSDSPLAWTNYVTGVIRALHDRCELPSMALYICSDLPMGCGLSSSAALECGVALAALRLAGEHLAQDDRRERVELAMLCNRVENDFVGVGSGVLDQGVVSLARRDHLVFFECRKSSARLLDVIPSPLSALDYTIVLVNTGTQRQLQAHESSSRHGYEEGLSEFNIRVARYWIGVAIATGLPGSPLYLDEGMSLCGDPYAIESLSVPSTFVLCSEPQNDENGTVCVVVRNGDGYSFGGMITEQNAATMTQYDSCPVIDMVKYAIREDTRVKLVANVLGNTVIENRKWLVEQVRIHANKSRHRRKYENDIANKLENSIELDQLETLVVFGLLGDWSWEDKRDLFRGDNEAGSLQAAYDCVDAAVSDPFGIIGHAAPGAGFGGMVAFVAHKDSVKIIENAIFGGEHIPHDFVPFVKRQGLGVNSSDVRVFCVDPSDGLREWQ